MIVSATVDSIIHFLVLLLGRLTVLNQISRKT